MGKREFRRPVDQGNNRPAVVGAHDHVHLPVPNTDLLLNNRGTLRYVHPARAIAAPPVAPPAPAPKAQKQVPTPPTRPYAPVYPCHAHFHPPPLSTFHTCNRSSSVPHSMACKSDFDISRPIRSNGSGRPALTVVVPGHRLFASCADASVGMTSPESRAPAPPGASPADWPTVSVFRCPRRPDAVPVVSSTHGRLGGICFAAAGCRAGPRDRMVGRSADARMANPDRVVRNHRFLILPSVRVHGLASRVPPPATDRIADDREARHRVRPALAHPFTGVDGGWSWRAARRRRCPEPTSGRRSGIRRAVCPSRWSRTGAGRRSAGRIVRWAGPIRCPARAGGPMSNGPGASTRAACTRTDGFGGVRGRWGKRGRSVSASRFRRSCPARRNSGRPIACCPTPGSG